MVFTMCNIRSLYVTFPLFIFLFTIDEAGKTYVQRACTRKTLYFHSPSVLSFRLSHDTETPLTMHVTTPMYGNSTQKTQTCYAIT